MIEAGIKKEFSSWWQYLAILTSYFHKIPTVATTTLILLVEVWRSNSYVFTLGPTQPTIANKSK